MTHPAPAPRPALDAIEGSLIREVAMAGRDIPGLIRLFFGEPDTVTPGFIRNAAKAALDAGETSCGPNGGIAPTFVQHAGVAAPDHGDAFVAQTQARYRACRDIAHGILSAAPGVTAPRPEGTMQLFLRVDGCTDSMAPAKALLHGAGLGVAPGAAFGTGGEGHLRLCFAQGEERLRTACTRIAQALALSRADGLRCGIDPAIRSRSIRALTARRRPCPTRWTSRNSMRWWRATASR